MPVQVIIKSPKGHNNTQKLMYDTSLLVFQSEIPDQVYKEPEYGLNLYHDMDIFEAPFDKPNDVFSIFSQDDMDSLLRVINGINEKATTYNSKS